MGSLSPLPEIGISMVVTVLVVRTLASRLARKNQLPVSRLGTDIVIGRCDPPLFLSWREQWFTRPKPIAAKPPDFMRPETGVYDTQRGL